MDAVGLDRAGDVDQVFVDHGHKDGVVFGGQVTEELVELQDVFLSVVGRESDAGKQDFDVRAFESGQHLVEVAAGLAEGQAAQPVVAAELDDNDFGVQEQDGTQAGNGVFGGGAAGSLIVDCVAVTEAVEVLLQSVRKGLSGLEAVAGGNTVSIADEERPAGGQKRAGQKQ